MVNVPVLMNSDHLDVKSIPSHQNLINYNTERKKYHKWVILTPLKKYNGGTPTPNNSITAHLQNFMNITTKFEKFGPLVPIH